MVQPSVVLFLEKCMYDKSRNTYTNILTQRTQCQAVGPKNKAQDLLHILTKIYINYMGNKTKVKFLSVWKLKAKKQRDEL